MEIVINVSLVTVVKSIYSIVSGLLLKAHRSDGKKCFYLEVDNKC